ncbi:flagellar export chaperone FliS [Sulfurimonas sp. HSL-1716]|uniref:flagellar export chaperone FliS n=1 Tax=Hydrocurvibacter sulfurireducens TaxID=3131937 RepID=UPI0031F748E1
MYQTNAYNTYAQNNVGVESPQKLIEMLYEGVLRFNTQAKRAIRDNDIEKRTYWINRSNAIFTELINTLDISQGDISAYLHGLYTYQLTLLAKANFENKESSLDEVNQVVRGLLEAWREETNVAE